MDWHTLKKPYSVRATKAIGMVEMKQPAIGMKEQINTNMERSPSPGNCRAHMPNAVNAVLAAAILACKWSSRLQNVIDLQRPLWSKTGTSPEIMSEGLRSGLFTRIRQVQSAALQLRNLQFQWSPELVQSLADEKVGKGMLLNPPVMKSLLHHKGWDGASKA